MIKKERKNNTSRISKFGFFSLFLIFIGILIFIIYKIDYYNFIETTQTKTEIFFENQKNDSNLESDNSISNNNYVGILEIPVIDFKQGFYDITNPNNKVSKNIQIIENSDMPDIENGLLVFAGHSGNGKTAFFKNLYKLEINDKIFIYYNNQKYNYEIINIYNEDKDGDISLNRNLDKFTLVLTTCNQEDKNKQIVVIAELVNITEY